MRRIDPIILGIIILIIVVIGGIILAASLSSPKQATQYSSTDSNRPKLEISQRNFEMGKIKLSDTQVKELTIKNVGTRPLSLSGFTTSCGCTTVQLIYKEEKSPEFSLHDKIPWQKDIDTGTNAIVKIKYEPKAMPVEGEVSRTVFFKTNDPDNSNVEINFKAFVEK